MKNCHTLKLICGMVAAWATLGALAGNPADTRHCGYWLHGRTMKDVDVRSLAAFGTTDVFLHEHAFTVHGQKDVEAWIAQATAAGLKVHIWMLLLAATNTFPVRCIGSVRTVRVLAPS